MESPEGLVWLVCLLSLQARAGEEGALPPVTATSGLLGGSVRLPCDTSPPGPDHPLLLTVWFKDQLQDPIYSYDVREDVQAFGKHWYDDLNLGGRAYFGGHNESAYLSIENLKGSDRGSYRCRVDFKKSPARFHHVFLEVVVPPSAPQLVTAAGRPLDTQILTEGENLLLQCVVRGGRPAPRVSWAVNGSSIVPLGQGGPRQGGPGNAKAKDTVTATLSLSNVRREQQGMVISCSAENTNLTRPLVTSTALNLRLLPLLVSIQSSQSPLTANISHSISCSSYGSSPPATVTWWLGATRLPAAMSQESVSDNCTSSELNFIPVREDAGKFLKCRAENPQMSASQIEDSWNIDINYRPVITLKLGPTLDPARIKEGDDVYFDCRIIAKPSIYKTSWHFNGVELKQDIRNGVIMGNQSLVLQRLGRANSGDYTCLASNPVGRGASAALTLDIKYKPICAADQKRIYGVARGEVVSINCSVSANPSSGLVFRWTFNNTSELANIQDSRFSQSGSTSRLIYSPFHELDYGTILCWAANSLGEQDQPCTFHIIPAGPPEAPQSCELNVTSTRGLLVKCLGGFDGGLPQHYTLALYSSKDGVLLANRSSPVPRFLLPPLHNNVTLLLRAEVMAHNSKGHSEIVVMPEIRLDRVAREDDGPITRAAQGGETDKKSDSAAELQEGRGETESPMMSILCGVVTAILVVILVIAITMKIRCGRRTSQTWRKDSTSESSFEISKSPDLLVKDVQEREEYEYQISSLFPAGGARTCSTLPRSLNQGRSGHCHSLMTIHALPPPPAPSSLPQQSDLVLGETLLPPPEGFFTLPRIRRSVSGIISPGGEGGGSRDREARVHREGESNDGRSRSISSIERLGRHERSNSHVESIV